MMVYEDVRNEMVGNVVNELFAEYKDYAICYHLVVILCLLQRKFQMLFTLVRSYMLKELSLQKDVLFVVMKYM